VSGLAANAVIHAGTLFSVSVRPSGLTGRISVPEGAHIGVKGEKGDFDQMMA
jgi:hypothetical protein